MTEYKCGSAKQCQFGEMCKPSYDIGGCNHFKQKKPQTNEEWFHQLSTEEKAYFLSVEAVRTISEYENNGTERTCSSFWEYWLKAVHKE